MFVIPLIVTYGVVQVQIGVVMYGALIGSICYVLRKKCVTSKRVCVCVFSIEAVFLRYIFPSFLFSVIIGDNFDELHKYEGLYGIIFYVFLNLIITVF